MCEHGQEEIVKVRIPGDLERTGRATWRHKGIDKCIAGIVRALQQAKIHMRGSCCGHMDVEGWITLQDGRVLLVLDKYDGQDYIMNAERCLIKLLKKRGIVDILKGEPYLVNLKSTGK